MKNINKILYAIKKYKIEFVDYDFPLWEFYINDLYFIITTKQNSRSTIQRIINNLNFKY
jgi:hypothetical protein